MRQPANASKLLAFFNGEAADNKLFVFYQPPAVDQGDVDAEGWPGNEQPPELFFSQGSTTRLTTKCCVFVRAVPPGTAIDLTKQSTAELLYCEALVAVSRGFIGNFEMSCSSEIKDNLMTHMGMVHKLTTDVCSEYFEKLRRAVYQTPKSYLSFIQSYTKMYKLKLAELEDKEGRVKLGLEKLKQGARDVEDMKGVLAEEDKKLAVATEETNKMLEGLQISSAEAQREGDKVAKDKAACEADAARIGEEKAAAEADLAKAQPFVDRANKAIESIKPKDIQEIKANKNPTDIIKMIFDCILILFKQPLDTVKPTTLSVKKEDLAYFETSFKFSGQKMLGGTTFLADLQEFGKTGKDLMNEETVEFLFPYVDLSLEQNGAYFTPEVAKKASSAAEGLCIFAAAMKDYFYASRVVKPKLEALGIAEANLNEAAAKLRQAEARASALQGSVDSIQSELHAAQAQRAVLLGEKEKMQALWEKSLADHFNQLNETRNELTELRGTQSQSKGADATKFAEMEKQLEEYRAIVMNVQTKKEGLLRKRTRSRMVRQTWHVKHFRLVGYSLLFKDVDGSNTGEKNFALDAASVVSEPPATEARGAASMKHVFRVTNSSGENGTAGDELILGAIDRTDLAEWMKLIGEAIAQLREKDEVLKSSLGRLTSNEGVTGDIQIRVGAED